jgi:hypothetical protein
MGFLINEELYGTPPKNPRRGNSKTSCTKSRAKYTVVDLIDYRFGVIGGQNVSTIKSNSSASMQDVLTGYMGGVAAQVIWPKGLVLQPEILYSRKGCIFTGNSVQYNIDYLEIPVKAMYRWPVTYIKPFAFVAPYWAYALKMTEIGDLISDDTLSNQINKFDYGIGAGAGFDVWKVQISFRYSWGFAQVLNEAFKVHNNTFTASVGIFFN